MKRIEIFENGIYLTFEITDEQQIKLLHFSALPFREEYLSPATGTHSFFMTELELAGFNCPDEHHGTKYTGTAPGYRLKYKDFTDTSDQIGRLITVTQYDEPTGVETVTVFRFFTGIPTVRTWTVITNKGSEPQTLEYISTFKLSGIEKEGILPQDDKITVGVCHNSWQREVQWQTYDLPQLGLAQSIENGRQRSSKAFGVTNAGNWSSKSYVPMGYIENRETQSALIFQIEHNGSWHWEIGDHEGHLYLQLSGPSELESHWWKVLGTGESFETVPAEICAVKAADGFTAFDNALAALTRCRRAVRRRNNDNERLPVIFNDYMNCLWGDPTAEKEYPLIDAAAETGCEYFCIDAGWYADGFWWDEVGEWQVSEKRFPDGLKPIADYIRSKGMIPGVWLELEVMGIKCPLAEEALRDGHIFMRHGKPVYDRSRYQLDFRDPWVIAHADRVIDRLVNEYGIGYIKMDYNIEPGIGTELNADSPGDGLLGHERAYLAWLDSVFVRYPKLVIENCSSGGLRMDGALLSRCSIQSTSDQEDYRKYCTIAANSPIAVCPEQSAVWSYPLSDGDREETVFNMINAMLLRIHQSGHLANIDTQRRSLVKEALSVYRKIRKDIRTAVPFYPIGVSHFGDEWNCLGLRAENCVYLAVWRRKGTNESITLPLPFLNGKSAQAECLYPSFAEEALSLEGDRAEITYSRGYTARLYRIKF